ncbi:MAG: hypothetical protein JWO48_1096 [Bryobacterales bacterium]|nr:hypothetical protein [Bryobacterales bacterium]
MAEASGRARKSSSVIGPLSGSWSRKAGVSRSRNERITDGRRGSPEARDAGGRGNRPHVLELVRAGVAAGGWSGQLAPGLL